MVSFYDMWLRIDELTKVSHIDSSGVELVPSGQGGYIYKFDDPSGGAAFVVTINRDFQDIGGNRYDGIWEVAFRKGQSYELTGNSGGGAVGIYSKVLAALKKLTEIEKVEGLKFSGAHPHMDIMYDKFTKAFGFVPVGNKLYMRKDIAEKEKASDVSGSVSAGLDSASTDHDNYVGGIRKSKNIFNQALKNKAAIVGKVVGFDPNMNYQVYPAVVLDIDERGFSILKYKIGWNGGESSFENMRVSPNTSLSGKSGRIYGQLTSAKRIAADEMSDMLANMKNKESRAFKELQKYGLHNFDGSTYELGFDTEAS